MEPSKVRANALDKKMERVVEEVDRVVRVQSGLQDLVEVLYAAQQANEKRFAALAESQKETGERVNALVQIVDGLIRRPPVQ